MLAHSGRASDPNQFCPTTLTYILVHDVEIPNGGDYMPLKVDLQLSVPRKIYGYQISFGKLGATLQDDILRRMGH